HGVGPTIPKESGYRLRAQGRFGESRRSLGVGGKPDTTYCRSVNLHLIILVAYSLGMIALGLIIGRRVTGTSDFFVARRQLGPGLIFSTMLAANIGAVSTVGATSVGYSGGIAAFWWVGAAALGSLGLAFWIGLAMRREAAKHDLKPVGDYLEYRYSPAI